MTNERCNRPAWRYYANGYRVCINHSRPNDPNELRAENTVGPCDFPLNEPATEEPEEREEP